MKKIQTIIITLAILSVITGVLLYGNASNYIVGTCFAITAITSFGNAVLHKLNNNDNVKNT